jgi:hypothetical protein
MKRWIGPALALVLLLAIGFAGYRSYTQRQTSDSQHLEAGQMQSVRGLIGSEKEGFFNDPRVQTVLRNNGLQVQFEKVGTRAIAQRPDLANFDFVHPSGAPAALKIQQSLKSPQTFTPFFTPMVIASWRQLLPSLIAEGLVKKEAGLYYVVDMARLLALIDKGSRWRDLKDNTAYAVSKSVLVSSTDVRSSNSAAMYLALASYIANDNSVVQSDAEVQKVLPKVSSIFLKQGFQESSSAGPFDDYISMGIGKAPMVMIYESQFLEYLKKTGDKNQANPDMVLLYPKPTLFSKHVFVAMTPMGSKLGQLLESNPELQALAVDYGYRTNNQPAFAQAIADKKWPIPSTLVDVIDPPSFEVLERMVVEIEKKYGQ